MAKKKTQQDRFSDLTWNDVEDWAGYKIVSRGKDYQRLGLVSDLALTEHGSLIAWVDGTERYATKVIRDEGDLPESICSCPYELDCKHAVAVVLEYLECIEKNQRVPIARIDDHRLKLLEDEYWNDESYEDEEPISEDLRQDIDKLLKGKTKAQLIVLIHDLARQYPEMARDLSDRKQMISGHIETMVERLRQEIRDLGDEPGWQDYWNHEGYTPDYSGIRKKLKTLLKSGHADEVLDLGRDLVAIGIRQVEESHDEGETAMEIATCMPVIASALDQTSLDAAEKLDWALDAVLKDPFELCEAFSQYLCQQHPKRAWHKLADQLLARLKGLERSKTTNNFSHKYERDRLSDWAIHALDQAGRNKEITPLCIAEAKKTGSYDRLVRHLVADKNYEDAELWIKKGILSTENKWPGIAAGLRDKLLEIRKLEKNWPSVAAIQVDEFIRHPSRQGFAQCKKSCSRTKVWPKVRESLLRYLEKGTLPWAQKNWPLPESGLDKPTVDRCYRFPLIGKLIDIAIFERKPDQVLRWYDHNPKDRLGWYGLDEDEIAAAVEAHAPDRAVAIWKTMAELLIAEVKPSAYRKAARYLRKAAKTMRETKKFSEWERYLKELRKLHFRKRRLIEILDVLDDEPIVKKRR